MARVEPVPSGGLKPDSLHVMHRRAAGLDVHKMQITASVRLAQPRGDPLTDTEEFSTLPDGLRGLTHWLLAYGVSAAAMEGTGIFWKAPFEALEDAGIDPVLYHARFVKQTKGRKCDVADSLMLAHYAVRHFLHEAAQQADEDPDRLSFIHAVHVIRGRVQNPGAFPPCASSAQAAAGRPKRDP